MSLGPRIRQARDDADLTQHALAVKIARVNPDLAKTREKDISRWENTPSPRLPFYAVAAIAKATGKPLSFFGEEADLLEIDLKVGELRLQGVPWEEIYTMFEDWIARVNAERAAQPEGGTAVPLRSAEDRIGRLRDQERSKGRGRRRPPGPQPPRNRDEDPPS